MGEETVTTGFTLAWPWLLALAPVPWVLRWLLPEAPSRGMQALKVPWYQAVIGGKTGGMRRPLLALVATAVWVLLTLAAARPQWVGEIQTLP